MLDGVHIAGHKRRDCFEQFVSEVLLLLAVNRLVEGDLVVLDEVLFALLLLLFLHVGRAADDRHLGGGDLLLLHEVLLALLLHLLVVRVVQSCSHHL